MNPDTFASDLLGYAAAGLVLLTFLAQSMGTLRAVAIASNVMFIGYALLADVPPVLLLHVLLLPLNAWRLWQASRTPAPTPARIEPTLPSLAPTLAAFRAGTPPVAPRGVGHLAPDARPPLLAPQLTRAATTRRRARAGTRANPAPG
jgi:hypothetical protein